MNNMVAMSKVVIAKQLFLTDKPIQKVTVFLIFALLVLSIDQLSKFIIEMKVMHGSGITITSFFNIVHIKNEGAAFSFLSEAGGWQRFFFISIAFIVSCWLLWNIMQKPTRKEAMGYCLILGGALANMTDRILRGAVVDFLDIHWHGMHWPVFNFADMSIVIGVCFMLWSGIQRDTTQKSQ